MTGSPKTSPQAPDEIEGLFILMAERYERRSLLITSHLMFSECGRIFKDPMMTAAIDRLVHHSVIVQFAVSSYRIESARKQAAAPKATVGAARSDDDTAGVSRPRTPGSSAPARSTHDRASAERHRDAAKTEAT